MALADVLAEVRRLIRDEPFEDYHTNAPNASDTTTALTLISDATARYEVGDVIEWYEDASGEQGLVRTVDSTTQITVIRGYNGTTKASHLANARFRKRPRHTYDQITAAVTDTIAHDLWPEVWVIRQSTLTYSSSTNLYDTPADYEAWHDIIQLASGSIEEVNHLRPSEELNLTTAISTTGKALRVTGWPRTDVTATLFYRSRYVIGDAVTAVETMIARKAAARLLKNEAAEKADRADDDTNRPFRLVANARELESEFEELRSRYNARLLREYGLPRRNFLRRARA